MAYVKCLITVVKYEKRSFGVFGSQVLEWSLPEMSLNMSFILIKLGTKDRSIGYIPMASMIHTNPSPLPLVNSPALGITLSGEAWYPLP